MVDLVQFNDKEGELCNMYSVHVYYRNRDFIIISFSINYVLVHVDLTITTKKLTELFATLKDDRLDLLGFYLDLPMIKTDEIKRNFHSPSQRREVYLDLYATDHPIPTWSRVALALRGCGFHSQAAMVKNTYVQGT